MWQARLKREVDVIHDPCFSILGRTSPHIQGVVHVVPPCSVKKAAALSRLGILRQLLFFYYEYSYYELFYNERISAVFHIL